MHCYTYTPILCMVRSGELDNLLDILLYKYIILSCAADFFSTLYINLAFDSDR